MAKDKVLSGNTGMLILSLLTDGDKYGYQMIEELNKRSNHIFEFKAGTLYPLLHTLEQQGHVEAYDGEPEKNRPRRYYQITPKGRRQLETMQKEWVTVSAAINSILGGMKHAEQY